MAYLITEHRCDIMLLDGLVIIEHTGNLYEVLPLVVHVGVKL